jgi:hypothetical protein
MSIVLLVIQKEMAYMNKLCLQEKAVGTAEQKGARRKKPHGLNKHYCSVFRYSKKAVETAEKKKWII